VIFHLHRETLVCRIERWTFWDSPRLQHTFHFQTEIVVETRGAMALHHKSVSRLLLNFWRGLRRFREAPFAFVLLEGHKDILIAE
jgi:hypothetical protein